MYKVMTVMTQFPDYQLTLYIFSFILILIRLILFLHLPTPHPPPSKLLGKYKKKLNKRLLEPWHGIAVLLREFLS